MTMDRTVTYGGGGGGGHCPAGRPPAQVPIGWQRRIHHGGVIYISPSGSVLACLEQAKRYLQTDGTCKCGLECPLILHKVFNFDPGAAATQRTAEDVMADSAVTKLCIHKRKIIAVATLHRRLGSQISSGCHIGPRKDLRNGLSNSITLDDTDPYKLPISGPQHYAHKGTLSSPPQRDAYAHRSRSRPGAGDHTRSPYRSNHHGGLLGPPPTAVCGSRHYGDGTPFLRSPESAALGFHGSLSPVSGPVNGERFGPLSPPSVKVHAPPPSSQLSCALAGRTGVPSSPLMNTKSPNRQRSPCGFPQNAEYPHKSPSSSHQQQHPIPQHTPYVVQKRCMSSSEKDPLGILDPIPSLSDFHDQAVPTPSRLLQLNNQPQVPSVHAPPAVVPLPSNLPMPVVKSGVVGSGPRVQQHPALSSISSSPIRSPVHMAVPPAPIRLKESLLHPHVSVSSSHYGTVTLAAQMSSQQQLPSRSLQGPISSPKTSVPLHHMAESVIQPLVAMNTGGTPMHSDSLRLPHPRTDAVNQTRLAPKTAPRQLDRQNPPTFPASSLLSAAAKAQLVHQNNLGGSSGHPGLVGGGGRQPYSDGCGALDPQYLCGSGVPLSEGQSGRAALRDKLMSQQRGAMRKRKAPGEVDGDMSFHMNVQHGPGPHGYPEPTKRLIQQEVATGDASMAPLVQPIHHQLGAQNGLSHACQPPGKPLFFEESVPSMSNMQNAQGPLRLQSRDMAGYRNFSEDCRDARGEPLDMEQFARQVNQTHNLPFVGNMRTLRYGGHGVEGPTCHQNSQQPQMGGHHVKPSQGSLSFKDGTGFPPVMSNGGFEMYPESGKARFLDLALRKAQSGGQWRRQQKQQQQQQQQPKDASGQLPVQAADFLQCPDSLSCCDSNQHPCAPGSINGLLRTFKVAERIPHPAGMGTDQLQGVGLPDAMFFQAGQQELAVAQGGHHRTEANPTGQQVRAGLRGEAASSVIVRNCAFSAAQAAAPPELSRSVIHGPPRSYPEEPVQRLARARRTPAKLKLSVTSAPEASLRFGHGAQTGQWSADANGGTPHGLCQKERSLLQAQAQGVNGNGFYTEFLARHAFPTPQEQSPSRLNGNHPRNGLLGQVRSGGHAPGSVIRSPEHCPASDGRQAYFPKRSSGYLNGLLSGNYGGRDEGNLNGTFVLNIADGQVSEERLGAVSLHHPGRPLAHRQPTQPGGDLLWAGAPSFHPWPSKMKMEGPAYLCSVGEMMQSKVEPVRFRQTLKDDLDTLHKANGIHLSNGAVNGHMEDAVCDAMGQWNKLTANVVLDGVQQAPKAKKRKIFR